MGLDLVMLGAGPRVRAGWALEVELASGRFGMGLRRGPSSRVSIGLALGEELDQE